MSVHLRYDAVLLDIDGTLVDSNAAHASAWSDAFATRRRHHRPEDVRPLIGKGGDKVLRELAALDHESGEGQQISEARAEIFKTRYLPTLESTPGAAQLVEWLRQRLAVVVATSAKREEVSALLAICGGHALEKDATTSDDAERSKPDPDIICAALTKSGASADRTIMIGDTPYDIEAAQRAGLSTIAFRCGGGWDDAHLRGAVAIYDDPGDLLRRIEQSPFFRDPARSAG